MCVCVCVCLCLCVFAHVHFIVNPVLMYLHVCKHVIRMFSEALYLLIPHCLGHSNDGCDGSVEDGSLGLHREVVEYEGQQLEMRHTDVLLRGEVASLSTRGFQGVEEPAYKERHHTSTLEPLL